MIPSADDRYSRQVALFGAAGQAALQDMRVMIVGLGGTGSHVAQQLALLGVGAFDLVDADHVAPSNLNRLIGGVEADVGKRKVDVAARMIHTLRSDARVHVHPVTIEEVPSRLLEQSGALMSCVDDDAARLHIIDVCTATRTQFIDLATDTGDSAQGPWFGGRVLYSGGGDRCPACMDLLDQDALRRAHMTPGQKAEEERIYGVEREALDGTGPAVVSVNGVIASLAVTEFLKAVTGIGEVAPLITYRGDRGTVHRSADPPAPNCFYCARWPVQAP
jgi:molybdopterin/thiamine biosynthesis adenylyltransferase